MPRCAGLLAGLAVLGPVACADPTAQALQSLTCEEAGIDRRDVTPRPIEGELVVLAQDAFEAWQGVANAEVRVTTRAGLTLRGLTDQGGCAVFRDPELTHPLDVDVYSAPRELVMSSRGDRRAVQRFGFWKDSVSFAPSTRGEVETRVTNLGVLGAADEVSAPFAVIRAASDINTALHHPLGDPQAEVPVPLGTTIVVGLGVEKATATTVLLPGTVELVVQGGRAIRSPESGELETTFTHVGHVPSVEVKPGQVLRIDATLDLPVDQPIRVQVPAAPSGMEQVVGHGVVFGRGGGRLIFDAPADATSVLQPPLEGFLAGGRRYLDVQRSAREPLSGEWVWVSGRVEATGTELVVSDLPEPPGAHEISPRGLRFAIDGRRAQCRVHSTFPAGPGILTWSVFWPDPGVGIFEGLTLGPGFPAPDEARHVYLSCVRIPGFDPEDVATYDLPGDADFSKSVGFAPR